MTWSATYRNVLPYVVAIETPEGSGTGFMFAYNAKKSIVAFATAAHVVEHAHEWKLPIKLRHHVTQKEVFVPEPEWIILLDRRRDSASVLIANGHLKLPPDQPPMIDSTKYKPIGIEVGWVGYPSIAHPNLCFFSGRISAFLQKDDSYLIDGVAINGVSGGPVFVQSKDDVPQVIGTVSAYMPNRIRGDALPGLLRAQDVTSFQVAIATMKEHLRESSAQALHQESSAGCAGIWRYLPRISRRHPRVCRYLRSAPPATRGTPAWELKFRGRGEIEIQAERLQEVR
jgi:hypothetical protein